MKSAVKTTTGLPISLLAFVSVFLLLLSGCSWFGSDDTRTSSYGAVAIACSEGMENYQVQDTPIQFCYDPAWGEPKIEDIATVEGKSFWVHFASKPEAPEIWYETDDYELIGGGSEIIPFCFQCLRMTASGESLKEQVAEELRKNYEFDDADLIVRKADISANRAVRVHLKKYTGSMGGEASAFVRYYVPYAFENYNMTVSSDVSMAVEIDNFVYDMVL